MTLRTCKKGHQYNKTSDCPTCPVCEKERMPKEGLLSLVSAPARRALENAGIRNVRQLSGFTESAILALHGIGKTSIPVLRNALAKQGLTFKQE